LADEGGNEEAADNATTQPAGTSRPSRNMNIRARRRFLSHIMAPFCVVELSSLYLILLTRKFRHEFSFLLKINLEWRAISVIKKPEVSRDFGFL